MKEGLRSASKRSGTLEKDKVVPSKKGSSGKQKVFESKKEKKRPQLEISDSESDKDLPIARRGKIGRGTNRDSNGSVVERHNEDSFERKAAIETDRKRIRSEKPVKYRNDFEEAQKEKKSRMEVFEYNEDDIVDVKKVIKAPSNAVGTEIVGSKVLGSKPRNVAVDKRKHSNFERNGGPDNSDKKRFKLKNDGAFRPVRSVREKSGVPVKKPIRVQGKNGVLKAKKMVAGVSKLTDKKQVNSRKILSTRGRKASRKRTEDSDTSMQMGPENLGSCSSKKETKNKGEAALTSEIHVAERQNEGKMGRSTKKELIRDQIRDLLLKSGWTIDFRPRRGRDYHDAVYISPSGSGYWSILKAYYVFQKQCKDEDSIPAEAIGLLTRKTHKKMEREMKMKEKADKGNNKAKENTMKDGKSLKVHYLEARKNKKQRGRALLGRSSNKEMIQDDDDFIPYNGKRSVLTWLIDSGIVPLNGKVKYMNKRQTRSMLEGLITRDGINCGCCSKIFTISKFEIHAGSKLCQPFQNMFVETGASLLQCQVDAWNKQEESQRRDFHSIAFNRKDPNDDTCGICGDGGDLICCDGCPSTFHISCLGIQVLPPGDWHCLNCSCKFCGVFGGSSGGGDDITTSKLLTCGLCEEKYHGSCIEQINAVPAESNSLCNSFCGLKCREVSGQFQKLLGVKHELEAGYSWTLIKRSVLDSDTSLDGLPQKAECNSKLAVALTVMDECFLPIVDRRSGINLIHNVLYNCGCNFNRLNYSGFFTAILERGDEIISAASIRIHGTRLAEMPFIGTRNIYRRQGMCRRLLNAIESALCSLKVEKLIIPAISELMHTWTVVFGFKPIEESHKQEMRSMNMLVFPGVDLLHKILVNQNSSEGSVTSDSVVKVIEPESSHDITPEETNKPDMGSSIRSAIIASDEIVNHHAHGISNNVAAVETILQDTSDATSNSSDAPYGTISHVRGEEAVCNNFQSQDAFPESELENKSIMDLPVDPNLQSSTEVAVAVGDAHEVNVEIAGNEPNLPVLDEIPIPNTSDGVGEHLDTVSGPDLLSTDCNALQDDLELNRQDLRDVESKSVDVSHPESDACEVETEATAVEPDLDIIMKPQGSSENNACYDLENKNQTLITVCESNCKDSDESSMNPNFDAADLRPDTVVKTEVAVTEHKSQAVGEDLVGCVSKVVGKSLYAPECRNDDLLPNTHDLEDKSSKTIHGDSSVHASIMANTLDTCKEEVRVVASVDHCQKILQ